MGSLALPAAGGVYLDTQSFIYTVERHPTFGPPLQPVWAAAGSIRLITSELTLLESLVRPYRSGDTGLQAEYESLFSSGLVTVMPITQPILRRGALLRAGLVRLRTADAIHAATALEAGAALFVTNDYGFRGVPGLTVEVLQDVLSRP